MIAPPPSLLPLPFNKRETVQITETPRDAMQGWERTIPLEEKVEYINACLKVGFDVVDVGSFVSPKAVPQMADTGNVLELLDTARTKSQVMVVVGNTRGAQEAAAQDKIQMIGFPYSTSPGFLKRNINASPEKAWNDLMDVQQIASEAGKLIRVYLSMAFGNPYGDPWSEDIILKEVDKLADSGFSNIVFSDITAAGSTESIGVLCSKLIQHFNGLALGIHLHCHSHDWEAKIESAWDAGFRNFEGAIQGYGGCPMTGYELLGNLDTLKLTEWCQHHHIETDLDMYQLNLCSQIAEKIFI